MFTTLEAVKGWLKLTNTDDDALVTRCVTAANQLVTRYAGGLDGGDVALAGTMLAARLYRRRNSPDGVQGMTDGAVAYVARTDPDVARLLRIDQYQTPQIG